MVSKVTLSVLVLCLCLSETLQFPDHNRTRRADDKPGLPGVAAPSAEDITGFLNVFANFFNPSLLGFPNKDKNAPVKSDYKEEETKEYKAV